MFLGLKFSGFVVLRPYKTPVVSILQNCERICTVLRDYTIGHR